MLIYLCNAVVYIPKTAVLSVKSCYFSQHISSVPYGHEAHLSLALALYGELCVMFFPLAVSRLRYIDLALLPLVASTGRRFTRSNSPISAILTRMPKINVSVTATWMNARTSTPTPLGLIRRPRSTIFASSYYYYESGIFLLGGFFLATQ